MCDRQQGAVRRLLGPAGLVQFGLLCSFSLSAENREETDAEFLTSPVCRLVVN